MTNPDELIDAHIDGKMDAREGKPIKAGLNYSNADNYYLRGYREEMKRLESPAYCRMRGLSIRVYGLCANGGGSAISGCGRKV